jgi:drug/metabolite transporter (DMT)-like permease
MLYLLLSIVCSSALVLFFKFFEQRSIPIFQAIVFNYWSASICSYLFLSNKESAIADTIIQQPWLPLGLGLGCLFIVVFNLISITTVVSGVSAASVASKLGLVFPVMLAFTVYGETFSMLKLIGILLAFVAVVLSSLKGNRSDTKTASERHIFLPLLVFFGSGMCDSLTQLATKNYIGNKGIEEFSLTLFIAAAVAGSLLFAYRFFVKELKISYRSILWGTVLGFVNYFSFLFLLKALSSLNWGSSVVFPLNNLGIVAFSTIVGVIFYKEQLSKLNVLGLLFAAASILVITLS